MIRRPQSCGLRIQRKLGDFAWFGLRLAVDACPHLNNRSCFLQHVPHGTGVAPSAIYLDNAGTVTASKRAKSVSAFNNWVSCDDCNKWRRVAQEPTVDKWYCGDNLDAEHSACSVPQEMSDAAIDIELNQIKTAAIDAGGACEVSEAAPRRQPGKCKHGRRRSVCKECGGRSICQHDRQRKQ